MKIAMLGPVLSLTYVELDSELDKLGFNSGRAKTVIGGPYVDFARKLASDGHEVSFLCELGSQIDPYIIRLLKSYNIDTQHIVGGSNGLVFSTEFRYNGELVRCISSKYSTDSIQSYVLKSQEEIFCDVDTLIFGYIDSKILTICNERGIRTRWYTDPNEIESWDFSDPDSKYIEDIEVLTNDNYQAVLK